MPFWEQKKRCENCKHYREDDPSGHAGVCNWQPPTKPFWKMIPEPEIAVRYDQGTDCETFAYDKHPAHPLDNARAYLALAQNNDVIPMRTYDRGTIDHGTARVVHHNRMCVTVDFLNARYRIRLDPVERPTRIHGGTVIGMERWGVDLSQPIQSAATFTVHPERAEPMLRNVKVGDKLQLIGYPPFDGMRRSARVVHVRPNEVVLKLGTRSVRHSHMVRKGPLAGTVMGDVWVLDTTDREEHTDENLRTPLERTESPA